MSDAQPGTPTPTERFDRLWDEIGAKRLTIGDEDKGVEVTIDADLSIFGILDKLKEAAESGHAQGEISEADKKVIARTLEDAGKALSGSIEDKLRRQLDKLTRKHR